MTELHDEKAPSECSNHVLKRCGRKVHSLAHTGND